MWEMAGGVGVQQLSTLHFISQIKKKRRLSLTVLRDNYFMTVSHAGV
jgi:hypothetical protein